MSGPRNHTQIAKLYEQQGLQDGAFHHVEDLHTLKQVLLEHPAYNDAKHPDHDRVVASAARLYAELHPDQEGAE